MAKPSRDLGLLTEDDLRKLSATELQEILDLLDEADREKKFNGLAYYQPYPKQREFHDLGRTALERLLIAGNRVGKTFCGAAEMAMHLTGRYPKWWRGRKFDRAIKAWASNDTGLNTRDIVQTKLCGPYGVKALQGSGAIPRECVDWEQDVSLARGVSDAYDTVLVKHESGEQSILTFKSYEQGRKKWQGDAIDAIWFDEEPPQEIYSEGTARLAPTEKGRESGIEYLTFTPLEGKTEIVNRFMDEESVDRGYISMTIEEAEHIDPKEKARRIASYLPHEREARARGVPMLGSGRVFQVAEEQIKEPLLENIPVHWAKLWGIDFGIGHPFGAVLIAWDRDTDVIHVVHALKIKDQFPVSHVAAMRPIGSEVPVAWPHDGNERRDEGKTLAQLYGDKVTGLKMLETHAQFPDGGFSTEAGLLEMEQRFMSGRLKVASHLSEWFEEYREYHRKDGKLVKIKDDLMSATRIAVMMRRRARPMPLGLQVRHKMQGQVAADVDFDVFA